MTRRLDPAIRRAVIIEAAHTVACGSRINGVNHKPSLLNITLEETAASCSQDTSVATIRRYFLTLRELRTAVVQRDKSFQREAEKIGIL